MSCYVINTAEYFKVAGILAALSEEKNRFYDPLLYLYDSQLRRTMGAEDYAKTVAELYYLNQKNVIEHYKDEGEPVLLDAKAIMGSSEYNRWFYYTKGCVHHAYIGAKPEPIQNLIMSVCYWLIHPYYYQTCDTDEADLKARELINKLVAALIDVLTKEESFGFADNLICQWTEWPTEPPTVYNN